MMLKPNKSRPYEQSPRPKTPEALLALLEEFAAWPYKALENKDPEGDLDDKDPGLGEGYNRCVYSMSGAAIAALNYMAAKLGASGFQAGAAQLEFMAESRSMNDGMFIIDPSLLLYPQHDLETKVRNYLKLSRYRLKDRAKELIAEDDSMGEIHKAHPDVRARWEEIAALPDLNEDEENRLSGY